MRHTSSLPVAPAAREAGVLRRRSFGRARLGALVPIALTAVLVPGSAFAQVEYIDRMDGFTQVVTTTDRGVKTIHVSGQVGQGETLQEHAESALEGVVRRLAQAGATPEDVVKIRIFVKDFTPDQYPIVAAARSAVFPEGHWPASTMVGVDELFIDT
ncbi:MAG: RidA family protein, partial [Acidobacteria bacterium]|nr:RidA family protein [Acidobacteriota bacterium]